MRRVNIGFEAGAVLAVRLDDAALDALRSAIASGGWHKLDTADGRVDLKLDELAYISEASSEPRIGFGGPQ